jgi:protein SCO1/2/putative membrane protein
MNRGFLLALAGVLLFAGAAHAQDNDTLRRPLGPVPAFRLTDQNGNTVTQEHLAGKVCVVSFFFTCCTSVCPTTQAAMARLQEQFAGNPDVLLISITVDPDRDNQDALKVYAWSRAADPKQWLFLRGSEKEVYDLVRKGFYQAAGPNPTPKAGFEILHTPNLMVIDHRGIIRGYASGVEPDEVERLRVVVKHLVQAKYLPAINAGLNATCGILLLVGFGLIKKRRVLAHKVVMLLAVAVSATFLGCYLYYHFVVLGGQPTRFSGEGPVRYLYFAILVSHTLLAAAVAPLALRVTYLGLRNRLARHTLVARWTLPLWLYVSVTGVVVYWMLYHLYPPA